jgi:hypothetical protein
MGSVSVKTIVIIALVIVLIILVITSCDVSGTEYMAGADAQATQVAAQVKLQRTKQVSKQQQAQAQAADAQATQAAQQTQYAQDIFATQQAGIVLIMQVTQTAWAHQATATAVDLQAQIAASEARINEEKAVSRQALNKIISTLAVVITAIVLLVTIQVGRAYALAKVEAMRKHASLIDTRTGAYLVELLPDGRMVIERAGEQLRIQQARPAQPVTVSQGEITSESPPIRINQRTAIELVKKSIELNGEDSAQIASHGKSGIRPERWQSIVNILKAKGLVKVDDRSGTYVADRFKNLDNLLYSFETGEIQL